MLSMTWPLHLSIVTSHRSQCQQHQIICNSPLARVTSTCFCRFVYAAPLPGWSLPHPTLSLPPTLHDQLLLDPWHWTQVLHLLTLLLSPSKGQVGAPLWTPAVLVKPLYLRMYLVALKLSTDGPLSDFKYFKSRECIFFTSVYQPHCTKHSINVYLADPNWEESLDFCDTYFFTSDSFK